MKILFLANASSIHTVRWVNEISERGYEVHLAFKFDDAPKKHLISEKVILHRLKYSGTKGYFLNKYHLKRIFKSIKPDIVNAHYASGYGTLARIAKMNPLILSLWGSDVYSFPYKNNLNKKLVIQNLRYADEIASSSKNMADQARKLLDDKDRRVYITPFGVDLKMFKRDREKTSQDIVIGNIKSLKEVYGIEYLIEAIKILKESLEDQNKIDMSNKIKVVIYGEGTEKDKLISLTEELKLESSIKFMGSIPNSEVPRALEDIDIFCATSNQESFGVSLIEAMAMELPVVATDTLGFKEVVLDQETGIIVETKNPQSIALGLEKLVLDAQLRKQYGAKGRQRVEELFDWEKNVSLMEKIYIDIRQKK